MKPATAKSYTYVFKTGSNDDLNNMHLSVTQKSYQQGVSSFDENV